MMGIRHIALMLLTAASSSSIAQNHTSVVLREGTPVSLAFVEPLNSGTAAVGGHVSLVLAEDIKVNGAVIAKNSHVVTAEVTDVKRAALAGRSGQITLRLDGMMVGDRKVKLRGSRDRTGESDVQYSRPYHLKWPGGLMRTGDNVEINQGTLLSVFVAEDVSLPATF